MSRRLQRVACKHPSRNGINSYGGDEHGQDQGEFGGSEGRVVCHDTGLGSAPGNGFRASDGRRHLYWPHVRNVVSLSLRTDVLVSGDLSRHVQSWCHLRVCDCDRLQLLHQRRLHMLRHLHEPGLHCVRQCLLMHVALPSCSTGRAKRPFSMLEPPCRGSSEPRRGGVSGMGKPPRDRRTV